MKIAITIPSGEKLSNGGSFAKKKTMKSNYAVGGQLPQQPRMGAPMQPMAQPAQPMMGQMPAFNRPTMAHGGKMQYMAEGGMVEGPPHEQGGVPVVEEATGEEMAEVEGGERIFSIEDTQMLEQAAQQIMELSQQDPAQADEAAKQLGFAVVEMLMRQEESQAQQEQPAEAMPAGDEDMMAQGANQFV